jgi:hypothetical protein
MLGLDTIFKAQHELKFGHNTVGRVSNYFWTVFQQLWEHGGMQFEFNQLHIKNRNYGIWVSEE